MEYLKILERLVSVFCLRKQQGSKPYNLLVTSCVSFTPEVCQEVCHSTDWSIFQKQMQSFGVKERTELLTTVLQQNQPLSGYQALARLIKNGYFSTIFMCSPDSHLEENLAAVGCRPNVLIVGGYSDEHIVTFLEDPPVGPCLIKLHGSLKEKVLPTTFPHVSALSSTLRDTLQRYLNQDLLIAGSIAYDQDIARLFLSNRTNSLYYVLPDAPDIYDEVRRTIEARGYSLDAYLLNGEQGTFNTFFRTLETQLAGNQGLATLQPVTNYYRNQSVERLATRTDVLLVTVTQIETDAVLELFQYYKLLHDPYQTYYDLGHVRGARVFLVQQPTMGSGDVGGSILTIFKGIQALTPSTVIMVGIAFGFDPEKLKIGDILVSEQIQMYEHQRVSSGDQNEPVILSRGARPTVSPRLLSRFKNNMKGWQGQQVAFGVILSGDKLIDNSGYRDQIRNFAPEALGGEMEGEGLHAATQDHAYNVDWILAKAISDWADGNKALDKRQNQQKAARSAAQFVFYVLSQGGFTSGG